MACGTGEHVQRRPVRQRPDHVLGDGGRRRGQREEPCRQHLRADRSRVDREDSDVVRREFLGQSLRDRIGGRLRGAIGHNVRAGAAEGCHRVELHKGRWTALLLQDWSIRLRQETIAKKRQLGNVTLAGQGRYRNESTEPP